MTDEEKQPEAESEASVPEATAPEATAPEAGEAKAKKKMSKKAALPEIEDDSEEGRSLKEAETAFEIGDYQTARALATKLSASSRPPIADRARDLLRRTDVDPVQMIFLAACACALIGVAFYYLQ